MARETSMHAVRFHEYGPPSVLVVDEVERPEPAAGEVLIRVHLAGVNPIDWKFRAGYLKDYVPLTLPHTPGLDLAGTIEALGDGVNGFAIGDRVFGRGVGTYADFAVAPATTIARIPENISFEQTVSLIGKKIAWQVRAVSLEIYRLAAQYADPRGILLADTKFEFGMLNDELMWIDEALTPDSSRFWSAAQYQPGGPQPSFDKQFVRDYLESIHWPKTPPGPELPAEVVAATRAKYREAYRILTGHELE